MMPEEINQPHRSRDSDALQAAFGHEGCPVCQVLLASMQQVMDAWQYEGFTDVQHRHEVITTRGFCPLHTWQLAQLNTAFQLGIIYRDILADVLPALQLERDTAMQHNILGNNLPAWRRWLKGAHQQAEADYAQPAFQACSFCQSRDRMEHRLIETLVEQMRVEDMRIGLRLSTGLCLLHFSQAHELAAAHSDEALRTLLNCQTTCLQRVYDEVQELVRKHEYRASHESPGEEMTSWRRAAELCAGNPGVR